MSDFELEIKNIQPINIKSMDLKWYILDENIRKSIILYNKAIDEAKTKELELAIKDLKKSLSFNKGFTEAIKLLGLCYANNKEYRRAENTFKKLMKNELYREIAKEYINIIASERARHKNLYTVSRVNTGSKGGKKQFSKVKFFSRNSIIGFSILIVFSTSFILTYWISSKIQASSETTMTLNEVVNAGKETNENPEGNNIVNEDYKNIQKKLDDTKSELDNYKSKYDILLMLNEAEKNYKDGSYEKAASTMVLMKNMKLDDETKVKFDKLWSEIKTKGLWSIYNQGNRLYKEGKYKEALPKLKIAYEIDPNIEIMPWLTYQIGMCYKETNDNTNALLFFQKVKDNYPKSKYVSSSEKMISQIRNKY